MTYEEAIRAKEYFERRLREGSRNTTAQVINFELAIEALEKVADLEKRGFTDEVLDNYKTFEDECIVKGFTFKSLIEAREKQTPKGKWISLEPEIGLYECSECEHKILRAKCNYCPNCGQRME